MSSNARLYRDLLKTSAEGISIWWPSVDGVVGDCGYILKGRFVTLFNVFNPPSGLPALPPPASSSRDLIRSEPLLNRGLALRAVSDEHCSLEATLPDPSNTISIGFTIAGRNTSAAFLIPGGAERRVDTYFDPDQFVEYLEQSYGAISSMWPSRDLSSLMILQSATRARGWCRGLARSTGHSISGSVGVSLVGVPTFTVGLSHGHAVAHPWLVQAGPSMTTQEDETTASSLIPENTIVVAPVLRRRRHKIKHALSAILPVPSNSVNRGRSAPSVPSATTSGLPSIPGVATSIARVHGTADDMTDAVEEVGETPTSDSESGSDGLSSFDVEDPPDALELFLDTILDTRPNLDAVSIVWDPKTANLIDHVFRDADDHASVLQNLVVNLQPVGTSGAVVKSVHERETPIAGETNNAHSAALAQPSLEASPRDQKRRRLYIVSEGEDVADRTSERRNTNGRATRHASQACAPCRQRKVKCDCGRPCASCKLRNVECTYSTVRDKRLTIRPEHLKAVEQRNVELETVKTMLERKLAEVTRERDPLHDAARQDTVLINAEQSGIGQDLDVPENMTRFGSSRVCSINLDNEEDVVAVASYSPLAAQLSSASISEIASSHTASSHRRLVAGGTDSGIRLRSLPESIRHGKDDSSLHSVLNYFFSASSCQLAILEGQFRFEMQRTIRPSQSDEPIITYNNRLYTSALYAAILATCTPHQVTQKTELHDFAMQQSNLCAERNVAIMSTALTMSVLAQLHSTKVNGARHGHVLLVQALTIARGAGLHLESQDPVHRWCYGTLYAQHVDIALHAGLEVLPYEPPNPAAYRSLPEELPKEDATKVLTFGLYLKLMTIAARMSSTFASQNPPSSDIIESYQRDLLLWKLDLPESHRSTETNANILLLHLTWEWIFDEAGKNYIATLTKFSKVSELDRAPACITHMTWTAGMASLMGISSMNRAQNIRRQALMAQAQVAIDALRRFGETKPCAARYSQMLEVELSHLQHSRHDEAGSATAFMDRVPFERDIARMPSGSGNSNVEQSSRAGVDPTSEQDARQPSADSQALDPMITDAYESDFSDAT
ncbi:hypothetical protein BKA62DRAFT_702167 [Auriculariales sp. MPI-PUGE-AT-0066]|nr:hypothetical protein BKA62DRAFT_702167 [Auriculariales sp. MPI-PUGE-AT-0066]